MTRFIRIGFSLLEFLFFTGTNKTLLYEGEVRETSHVPQKTISIIYRSVDGGRSWMAFDTGIPAEATVSSFLVYE